MDKFWQALTYLLPSGFAWPRDPNSTLMRVMLALAGALNDLHEFTRLTVNQWQPHQTITRLAEWEEATGLPDACFTPTPELVAAGSYDVGAFSIATFSRAGPATYFDSTGVLKTALTGVPRYTYNPSNLAAAPFLLLEDAATNLLLYSEQFDNACWDKTHGSTTVVSVAPNASFAPDGSMTADYLTADTAGYVSIPHWIFQQITCTNQTYTASFHLKAGLSRHGGVQIAGSAGSKRYTVVIDLLTGVMTSSASTGAPGGTAYSVQSAGNGWWKISATAELDAGFAYAVAVMSPLAVPAFSVSGAPTFVSDGYTTLLVWGGELKASRTIDSYIPSTSFIASRAADICTRFPDQEKIDSLRRKLLLSRLRGPALTYSDSSPSSTDAIVAICAWLGYTATVKYNVPFRCGQVVGKPLGTLDGNLYVVVAIQSTPFRVGKSRVGDRLLDGQLNGGELACYLKRVVPARYQLNVIFGLCGITC